MKKLFTLIAAALMAVGASAEEVTLWEGEATCDKWSGVGMLSDAGLELIDASAQPGDMIKIYADVTAAAADWQLLVQEGHYDKIEGTQDVVTYAAFKQSEGDFADGTATFELTEAIYKRAITKSWWGNTFIFNGNGGVVVKKLSLVRPVHYAETAKTITFNESGFIAASEFDGLNDRAKIVFTYNRAEEPVADHKGWGVGRVASNDATDTSDPTVKLADLGNNQAGDMSVTILMIDIKRALEATPAGIAFSVWDQDGSPTTRVKVEAFDAIADSEGGEEPATKPVMISWGADDIAAAGKAKSSYGTGDFTMSITDTDGKVAVDANDCYFGDATTQTKFTHRLKSGGKSGSKLSFSLAIPSDGTLKVYARTGSNSATDRTLVLTQGGSELYNQIVKEADAVKVAGLDDKDPSAEKNVYPIISVSAKKGDVVVTFPVGSMNFYGFEFVSGTSGIQQTIAPAKVIENNVIYNLAGQKVNESYKGIVIKNGKKYIQK